MLGAIKEGQSFNVVMSEISSASGLYSTEEVFPTKRYKLEFRSIVSQLEQISGIFKVINWAADDSGLESYFGKDLKMPSRAEGLLVVPKAQMISPQYHIAFKLILLLLNRNFPDFFVMIDDFNPQNIRMFEETRKALSYYDRMFEGGYIILPVQLGKEHNGRSARCARGKFLIHKYSEFGLDPFTGAIAILSNPTRIGAHHSHMTCCGALYSHDGKRYDHVLQFAFVNGRRVLRSVPIGEYTSDTGIATAFFPSRN